MRYEVRLINDESDLRKITNLHEEAFPKYFLTCLGRKVVLKYYKEYFLSDSSEFYCAYANRNLVAFVLFSESTKAIKQKIHFKTLPTYYLLGLYRLAAGAFMILNVLFKKMNKIFRGRKGHFSVSKTRKFPHTRLLSIATTGIARGSGCTELLVQTALSELGKKGIASVGLSVFTENKRAQSFYRKVKFELERREAELTFYYREI